MPKTPLDDLKHELAATQYWLRILYGKVVYAEGDAAGEAHHIRELIKGLKNQGPPPGVNPARYDQFGLDRLPHIERIGSDIAEYLESFPSEEDEP